MVICLLKCLVVMAKAEYIKTVTLAKRGKKRERIFEVDFLRGFDIILMVAVHFCYAASSMGVISLVFDRNSVNNGTIEAMNKFCSYVFSAIVFPSGAQDPICYLNFLEIFFSGLFVFLSGISCSFTKNNTKRAFQLAYFSTLMTIALIAVSVIAKDAFGMGSDTAPAICIICGILQSISIALLIYSLVDHFFPKFYQTFLFAIAFSVIAIVTSYFYVNPDTRHMYTASLPDDWWTLLLGTKRYGDDYFSPTQITAALFLGASFGKLFYREKKSLLPPFPKTWAKPILFLGRHSLLIYIVHQPFMYLFLFLLYLSMGYKVQF